MMPAETEPWSTTDPALLGVLDELMRREPIFHRREYGASREDFEKMTAPDFWETGASGRRYSRKYVLNELERRSRQPQPDVWETSEFHCRELAADVYLVTYTLLQNNARRTRRATIWRRMEGEWKIVFHQGTLIEAV
jgi:hypothetical protein